MRSLALVVIAPLLSGCFFVYVPGSVTTSVNDALTGEHGRYCVAREAKVGDRIHLPDGGVGVITALTSNGHSFACKPKRPIRAEIERTT